MAATVYLRTLGFTVSLTWPTIRRFLRLLRWRPLGTTSQILLEEPRGNVSSYLSKFKKTFNSWLAYNGVNVKLKQNREPKTALWCRKEKRKNCY